ncbi:hypothetical protein CRENBAI_005257 [Crenichthys baileyi]|uniref:Uncharacterized protein n=1 Tax=Crenichthys baileyi TaxID=28760 RepID=A0AAV9RBF7_9TELE
MSSGPSLSACSDLISFLSHGFLCPALHLSDSSLASGFWTLTLFMPPDLRSLPGHWVYKPESPCDVILLSPKPRTEELKFTFPILQRILKRFLSQPLQVVVSCRTSPRAFNKPFELSVVWLKFPVLRTSRYIGLSC